VAFAVHATSVQGQAGHEQAGVGKVAEQHGHSCNTTRTTIWLCSQN
jgi:hypothetical protein